MKKVAFMCLTLLGCPALAENSGIKPGLWEMKTVRQVVDGHDISAQIASAQAEMQRAMAGMSAVQRQQMEAMMERRGGHLGITRLCISPAMAVSSEAPLDPEGRCPPADVSRDGNTVRFRLDCAIDGRSVVGMGESAVGNDRVATRLDMVITDAGSRHRTQSETVMRYVGADCRGVKPADRRLEESEAHAAKG
jgi:hypothetical protein